MKRNDPKYVSSVTAKILITGIVTALGLGMIIGNKPAEQTKKSPVNPTLKKEIKNELQKSKQHSR